MQQWFDFHIKKNHRETIMVSKLKHVSFEQKLEEIRLLTLQERQTGGDLITMFKLVSNMEKIDREDLVTKFEEGERCTRGHKKLKKSQCLEP